MAVLGTSYTLILDQSGTGFVYFGEFTAGSGNTAHKNLLDATYVPLTLLSMSIGKLYGGSIKADGTIEMNSGTLNKAFQFEDTRDRSDLIPTVEKLMKEGKCKKIEVAG